MPSTAVLRVLFRELTTLSRSPRQQEPALVMDDPSQVADYVRAGLEGGVLAPVYIFHCANICEIIRPGDCVLDLGCGPANQLAMVARLNPDTQFVGVDLSQTMLEQAQTLIRQQGLKNVNLRHADITDLADFADTSFDAVISTVALHHLPDTHMLGRALAEAARVLKAEGGVYLVDFGHLKSEQSIEYFAHQYEERQPPLFTVDYLNSLRAAFSEDDFGRASSPLMDRAKLYTTFLCPYMIAIKSPPKRNGDTSDIVDKLTMLKNALPAWHKVDLADLRTFFRLGGLTCQYI